MFVDSNSERVELDADEYVLSSREVLTVLRKRWRIIALVTLCLVTAAVGYSLMREPTYEGSIKILVGQNSEAAEQNLGPTVDGLQQLTPTLGQAVTSVPVAENVVERLDIRTAPGDLLSNLSVTQLGTTQFLLVTYTDSDPQRAQQVVSAIGEVFSEQISEISPTTGSVTATVWEPAQVSERPVFPSPLIGGVLALVFGLMFGVALVLLLEYFDDRLRSPDETEAISTVPNLGVIPKLEVPAGSRRNGTYEKG